MRCWLTLPLILAAALGWAAAQTEPPRQDTAREPSFAQDIQPLLARYCTKCHGGDTPRADLSLEKYKDAEQVLRDRKVWEKVVKNVRSKEMPPANKPQPTPAEAELLAGWVEAQLAKVDCTKERDPGRVTIRRLNRAEYNNTIRDLLGVDFQPAEDFPADDVGYGFDNIGDVLSLPPILLEKYLAAAETIIERVFATPAARKRLMICDVDAEPSKADCARKIIEHFATRAYRRPVRPDEMERLLKLVELAEKNGDSFETGIQLAAQAVLVSPHFLFRIETDPPPNVATPVRTLNNYELATRLSYFLWSSMPDEELFNHARNGTLRENGNLEAQVKRMLKDPKARALVENFAGQWLQLRNLKTVTPDPGTYPAWDEKLRAAMQKETELFFAAILREDRSVLEFLDADFTFLNERLARHYGIDGVQGEQFRRVQLTGKQRGGVLTQASVLTVTSNPTRTSPVKRGKYILENILGTPPPPPPPDVPELDEDKELTGSLRQRMEQHRAKPLCASCHQRMDPLGFGLENFDGLGAWRGKDGKFPIDASGVLPGGEKFNGPAELKAVLKEKKVDFCRCLTEKMLTYALGRGLEYYDKCVVDDIVAALAKNDYRFTALVLEIVKSEPFQKRRGRVGRQ
jgi:mono/diheme cytochrome c family protein